MLILSPTESPLCQPPWGMKEGRKPLGSGLAVMRAHGHRGSWGHFKKIKVISCCSCWQGPVQPEPGGLKQFHNPGDFLLIRIMKPITNIKSHSLKQQPERGRDALGPLRAPVPPGTAALAPPGEHCPPETLVLCGGTWGGGQDGAVGVQGLRMGVSVCGEQARVACRVWG